MIKLVCENCGRVWYTANTEPNQKCSVCGGNLYEVDMLKKLDNEDVKKTAN
ncbi:hypothetical protein M2651_10110 [Clostridium sp. SYSU_GA19001]|uniref:hypothetical protein n=1 Tax=Clostridium caldaquaticum TaxID=2940653 RepID=UPI002077509C|nr:hypothetical protein [Clostridium caldaquaticum]MCM8711373.1 hypothetical protein [Clostridium caldaquaticum]